MRRNILRVLRDNFMRNESTIKKMLYRDCLSGELAMELKKKTADGDGSDVWLLNMQGKQSASTPFSIFRQCEGAYSLLPIAVTWIFVHRHN